MRNTPDYRTHKKKATELEKIIASLALHKLFLLIRDPQANQEKRLKAAETVLSEFLPNPIHSEKWRLMQTYFLDALKEDQATITRLIPTPKKKRGKKKDRQNKVVPPPSIKNMEDYARKFPKSRRALFHRRALASVFIVADTVTRRPKYKPEKCYRLARASLNRIVTEDLLGFHWQHIYDPTYRVRELSLNKITDELEKRTDAAEEGEILSPWQQKVTDEEIKDYLTINPVSAPDEESPLEIQLDLLRLIHESGLSERDAKLMILHYHHGRPINRIWVNLGYPSNDAAKKAAERARKKIKLIV